MITEELTNCPKCGYPKAITHWSSDDMINWVACPRCRTFFDHRKESREMKVNNDFWGQVEKDTNYKGIANKKIVREKKMVEQNIIKQDMTKIKNFFLPMREGFINLIVFMLRWMMSWVIAGLIIKALNIPQHTIINGFVDLTLIIGGLIVYFTAYLFHQTYNLEKYLQQNQK